MTARNFLSFMKDNPTGPIWEPKDLSDNAHWQSELSKRAKKSKLMDPHYKNNPSPCEVLFIYSDGRIVHAREDEIQTLLRQPDLLCVKAVFPAAVQKLQITPFLEFMKVETEPA